VHVRAVVARSVRQEELPVVVAREPRVELRDALVAQHHVVVPRAPDRDAVAERLARAIALAERDGEVKLPDEPNLHLRRAERAARETRAPDALVELVVL